MPFENHRSKVITIRMTQKRELLELLDELIDGAPTEEQQHRLGELLQDPETQRLYLEYFELHAELGLSAQGFASPNNSLASSEKDRNDSPKFKGRKNRLGIVVVATALSLAAVFLALWNAAPSNLSTEVLALATIIESESAAWTSESAQAMNHQRLAKGHFELQSGQVELLMNCGARVSINAPAKFELIDAKAMRLFGGGMTVNAPDSAVGFRILTPTADVVDLGTEFHVAVEELGTTEVHVSQGVVVARSTGSEAVVPILHGEAGRIDIEQGDIVSMRFDATRFGRPSSSSVDMESKQSQTYPPLAPGSRVVFLGDRTTDRETHLLLIGQALEHLPEAEQPKLFNRGVCFPLLFDEADFEEHITAFHPTHAMLEFGSELATNTGRHLLSQKQFEQAIRRLCDRLERENIIPILSTGHPLQGKFSASQPALTQYNAFLRRLANDRGYRVIDVENTFRNAEEQNVPLIATNGRWPTFEGHRQIAQAILATWGYPDAKVDRSLDVSLLPGVITNWQYRHKTSEESLTVENVNSLDADETWKTLSLPQRGDKFARRSADRSHSITYRDRARGFATNLHRKNSHGIEAIATVYSDKARTVYLNTGATLRNVWLNGERIHQVRGWTGWHAGKQRIPVELRAGENQLVIEAGSSFFVSLTNEYDWPLN